MYCFLSFLKFCASAGVEGAQLLERLERVHTKISDKEPVRHSITAFRKPTLNEIGTNE